LGAGPEMDAYFVATTLPQYVAAVASGAVLVVLLPTLVRREDDADARERWELASCAFNVTGLTTLALGIGAAFFAAPIIRLTTPGLPAATMDRAVRLAAWPWPASVL